MSEAKGQNGVQVRLEGVRHCFTFLYEPHISKQNGKKDYRDTFLIEPGSENNKKIRAAISQAARNLWQDKAAAMIKSFQADRAKVSYRDGNTPDGNGNVMPELEGLWTLTAIWVNQPKLKGPDNRDISDLGNNGDFLFPGAYVTAVVEIWPQAGTNAGMRCQLQGVRHDRSGERIGGGGRAARDDEFGPAPGKVDDDLVGSNPDSDDIAF